jgi:hypothetical protein
MPMESCGDGDIDWVPVSAGVAATATILATIVALLVAYRVPDSVRAPRLRLTFRQLEPWCRSAALSDGRVVFWVRLGVENAWAALPASDLIDAEEQLRV